jgi:hypothetical protein
MAKKDALAAANHEVRSSLDLHFGRLSQRAAGS